MAQHHQRGYGTEAAGPKVHCGAVVNLAVDHRVHQPHDVGGQFSHCRRGLWVVVRPVVEHTELGGGLLQVHRQFLVVILVVRLIFRVRLVGMQKRIVFVVVFGGHGVHLAGVSPPP